MLEKEKTGTDKEAEKTKQEEMEIKPEDGATEKTVIEEVKKDDDVVIDGKEYTIQEVKSQMLMQKDYTKKTTGLSAKKKELAEVKNLAETLVYTTEKAVKEAGDKLSADDKKDIENKISGLKEVKDIS